MRVKKKKNLRTAFSHCTNHTVYTPKQSRRKTVDQFRSQSRELREQRRRVPFSNVNVNVNRTPTFFDFVVFNVVFSSSKNRFVSIARNKVWRAVFFLSSESFVNYGSYILAYDNCRPGPVFHSVLGTDGGDADSRPASLHVRRRTVRFLVTRVWHFQFKISYRFPFGCRTASCRGTPLYSLKDHFYVFYAKNHIYARKHA